MKLSSAGFFSLVALFYLGAISYITYPLVFHLGTLSYGVGDEVLVAYFHAWVQHTLFTNPLSLFQANIYFPYHNTFAYSEPFILTSILTYIPVKLIGQPIAATNLAYLFGLFSLASSTCFTAYYFTRNRLTACISGFLILFSPYVIDKAVQVQVILCCFVPLSWICLTEFLKTKQVTYWYLLLICFVLQFYTSLMPAYFLLISNGIILLFFILKDKSSMRLFLQRNVLTSAVISLFLILPLILPFYHVSKEFSYVRDIRDTIHFALQPEDLLYPNYHTRLQPFLSHILIPPTSTPVGEVKAGYIGAVFSLLLLFSYGYIFWERKTMQNEVWIFTVISLSGLMLSFGSFLHLGRVTIHHPFPIPLPYLLTYYLIPGFQAFRNSSRFEMLFIIAGSILIAQVLGAFLKNKSPKTQLLFVGLLLIGIVGEYNIPMTFYSIPSVSQFPQIEQDIAKLPSGSTLIHLPIYTWDMQPYNQIEIDREYYSTIHFKQMVNGYSGFSPLPWQDLVRNLDINFPNSSSLSVLRSLQVNYLVFHEKEYDTLHQTHFLINKHEVKSGEEIRDKLFLEKSLKLIKQEGSDYLFKVL
jgi:hypothetical protein